MREGHSGVGKPAQALTAIRRIIIEGGVLSFEKGMEIEYESAVTLPVQKIFLRE
jgi:hypothetical protein